MRAGVGRAESGERSGTSGAFAMAWRALTQRAGTWMAPGGPTEESDALVPDLRHVFPIGADRGQEHSAGPLLGDTGASSCGLEGPMFETYKFSGAETETDATSISRPGHSACVQVIAAAGAPLAPALTTFGTRV